MFTYEICLCYVMFTYEICLCYVMFTYEICLCYVMFTCKIFCFVMFTCDIFLYTSLLSGSRLMGSLCGQTITDPINSILTIIDHISYTKYAIERNLGLV